MNITNASISTEEALILQYISEVGEEDIENLSYELHESKIRLTARVKSLKNKGLIAVANRYHQAMFTLSKKGKRTLQYLWPELSLSI